MRNGLIIITLMLVFQLPAFAQGTGNVWNTLTLLKVDTDFSSDGNVMAAGDVEGSRFLPMIEKLDGTEIEVKGYIIPLSGKQAQSNFMFSAYPYNMCFFCGKAGPESVMDVTMKDDKTVDYSEKPIYLKGNFRFQPNDLNGIFYKLENAVFIKK